MMRWRSVDIRLQEPKRNVIWGYHLIGTRKLFILISEESSREGFLFRDSLILHLINLGDALALLCKRLVCLLCYFSNDLCVRVLGTLEDYSLFVGVLNLFLVRTEHLDMLGQLRAYWRSWRPEIIMLCGGRRLSESWLQCLLIGTLVFVVWVLQSRSSEGRKGSLFGWGLVISFHLLYFNSNFKY